MENGSILMVYAPIKPEYSTVPTIVTKYPVNLNAAVMSTNALANSNKIILDEHESMLLGLALNYIDLDARITSLENSQE